MLLGGNGAITTRECGNLFLRTVISIFLIIVLRHSIFLIIAIGVSEEQAGRKPCPNEEGGSAIELLICWRPSLFDDKEPSEGKFRDGEDEEIHGKEELPFDPEDKGTDEDDGQNNVVAQNGDKCLLLQKRKDDLRKREAELEVILRHHLGVLGVTGRLFLFAEEWVALVCGARHHVLGVI
jgi:hypothetical protein